jgi:hypothetical protein
MYSIVVKYHLDVRYYSVAIKEDGIDESSRRLKLHTE